jgi:tetratricopeptide (TPR) repeat protein
MHQGGRHWQEFLAEPGMAYLEIQAGLAPTQLHHLPFPAGESWHWTEFFGYMQADPGQVHHTDYNTAWHAVDAVLKQRITARQMAQIEADCLDLAERHSSRVLQNGSGWGALEMERRGRDVLSGFYFPEDSLGKEQSRWLKLLAGEGFSEHAPQQDPGEWLVQKEWRALLGEWLEKPANRTWDALLHYGVMLAETFDYEGAAAAWHESIARQPSAWAYRNLAVLAHADGKLEDGLALYAQAWPLALQGGLPLESLAHEYLSMLVEAGQYMLAAQVFQALPPEAAEADRVQILWAMAALKLNRLEEVEQVLQRDFATVREGQVDLTNLWFELWQRREAMQQGKTLEEIDLKDVKAAHPAPPAIDFRSVD